MACIFKDGASTIKAMITKTKIYFLVGLALIVFLGVWILSDQPPLKDALMDTGFLDEFTDLSIENSTRFETKGSITGIDIYFDGKIEGQGILTIGDSDTTVYRQYNLHSGNIDIHHSSDWYADICIVRFFPKGMANGNITINCNFTGD